MMKRFIIILVAAIYTTFLSGQGRYDAILSSKALMLQGEPDKALAVLTAGIVKNPSYTLYLCRGEVYLAQGNYDKATSDFMTADHLEEGSGLYDLARCAAARGDARAAASYMEAHLKSEFKKSEPEILLDDSFNNVSSATEWKNLWKKDWYKGYERKSWQISNFIKTGRPDLAEETYNELTSIYPDMPVTVYCNALIMMTKGYYSKAADELRSLVSDEEPQADRLLALATAEAGAGNYLQAAGAYELLIQADYPDTSLYLKRGEMLIKAEDYSSAKDELQKFLDNYPDNFKALSLIGQVYAEAGAIYEALPYLNRNVENNPGEAEAFSLRGDAWFAARTWDKACEDYSMSLDIDPGVASVNLNMGLSLVYCGKDEEACHYLRKALDLGEKKAVQYINKYCIR